jgi:hypothetical protein
MLPATSIGLNILFSYYFFPSATKNTVPRAGTVTIMPPAMAAEFAAIVL